MFIDCFISLWIKKKKKRRQAAWQGHTQRKLHTSKYTDSWLKENLFFIPIKVQSITISNAIPYISKINSTSSSLKKKFSRKRKGEGKRKKESAIERRRKGEEMREREEERVRTGRKRRRKKRRNKRKRKKRRKKGRK